MSSCKFERFGARRRLDFVESYGFGADDSTIEINRRLDIWKGFVQGFKLIHIISKQLTSYPNVISANVAEA